MRIGGEGCRVVWEGAAIGGGGEGGGDRGGGGGVERDE